VSDGEQEEIAVNKLELEFVRERETKGTWRYQEVESTDGEPAVGTLYLQKAALGERAPDRLRVTIEEQRTGASTRP
jgi:hypothetical protein